MRALVARLAGRFPAVDVAELPYSRTSSNFGEAAAWLTWLIAHPDEAAYVDHTSISAQTAFHDTDHPEQVDEDTERRARALAAIAPAGLLGTGIPEQAVAAAHRGLPALLAWLDDLAVGQNDTAVTDLSAERARRRQ